MDKRTRFQGELRISGVCLGLAHRTVYGNRRLIREVSLDGIVAVVLSSASLSRRITVEWNRHRAEIVFDSSGLHVNEKKRKQLPDTLRVPSFSHFPSSTPLFYLSIVLHFDVAEFSVRRFRPARLRRNFRAKCTRLHGNKGENFNVADYAVR